MGEGRGILGQLGDTRAQSPRDPPPAGRCLSPLPGIRSAVWRRASSRGWVTPTRSSQPGALWPRTTILLSQNLLLKARFPVACVVCGEVGSVPAFPPQACWLCFPC